MSEIEIPKEHIERTVSKIKDYFQAELGQEIGGFEAEFLIAFFAQEVGPHFYNQGITDAFAVFSEKTEELGYLIQELEKPVG